MAIKKQNKRSLEDAAAVPAQNGSPSKKANQLKKVKSEKAPQIQNNLQKIKKIKTEAVEQPLVKPMKKKDQTPLSAEKIAAKKLKNAEKRAKRLENRKEARKEGGQYKPERTLMSVEQLQLRIDAIVSRPELTKTAKRRLSVLRKRMQIAKGTYVEKPKPESTGPKLTPSQKRHGKKIRSKARKLEDKLKEKIIVSDKITSGSDAAATAPVKQESAVIAKTVAAKGKPAKPGKQQQQKGKGKGAKQPIVKKEEPEESEEDEDDDEEAEDEEDSDEEVDTSAAELMNTTAEDEDEDDDEEEDDDEDDEEDEEEEEEDDEDDEAEEEEVAVPVKKPKKEALNKKSEEKKPFVKKENAKGNFKNGPAANGDSQDGKKKRFVLFVGNLPYE